MSISTTAVRTPVVTIGGFEPSNRPTLRADLDRTALVLAEKKRRVAKYKRTPAKNVLGEPLPMPRRFVMGLYGAQQRFDQAVAAYDKRYGVGAAKKALAR